MTFEASITVIDSHTGGEPTRVVVAGGPDLGAGSMAERLAIMQSNHDHLRAAIVNEPRGSDVLVGALLCEPVSPDCAAGVIFFNNVGYLSMCGHGSIGLAVTLLHHGQLSLGSHRLETPAGEITVTLHDRNLVSVSNVESYRHLKDVSIDVPGIGRVTGDVAWGGNWFFLISEHGESLTLTNVTALTDYAWAVRGALETAGIRGSSGETIDHIELFGPPSNVATADSKNFVLCPGRAYDRSPCGTGTSAKLACLIEDGHAKHGEIWRQESITGSIFEASAEASSSRGVKTLVTGSAFITAESTLLLDPTDPFRFGLAG
ncbi:MAG: proline racemase family protein [Congregibacter sp.]